MDLVLNDKRYFFRQHSYLPAYSKSPKAAISGPPDSLIPISQSTKQNPNQYLTPSEAENAKKKKHSQL